MKNKSWKYVYIFDARENIMDNKTNLLKETLVALQANNFTTKDVLWVGDKNGIMAISWEKFKLIAEKIDYYAGYEGPKIAKDLVIVGKDWWLERHEYDGREWWEFKTIPQKAENTISFEYISINNSPNEFACSLMNLASINNMGCECCRFCAIDRSECFFGVKVKYGHTCIEWQKR
jgi:hypothetical protein